MISESPFSAIFGAVTAGGDDSLVHLARAAVRAGYALVACKPGTKHPMCTLTARDAKKANEQAQLAARNEGKRRWDKVRHDCGVHEALTDDKAVNRVIPRLIKTHGRINLGVEVGRSKLAIVDVDTVAELAAFRASWEANTNDPFPPMTVSSPGIQDDGSGEWVHKGGGHFYFSVPDNVADVLARHVPGSLKVAQDNGTGWSLFWKDRQVLVPPSIRAEGPYRLTGDVYPLPDWMLRYILTHIRTWKLRAEEQAARRAEARQSGDLEAIDEWAASIAWSDLLEADGWTDTGDSDRCGCPIFTAPGGHASPKSATAHEEGCATYDDSSGHCPLHIWTDNPPEGLSGGGTYNKLRYLALTRYGSDSKDAQRRVCRDEGIPQEKSLLSSLIGLPSAPETLPTQVTPSHQHVSPNGANRSHETHSPLPETHLNGHLNGAGRAFTEPRTTATLDPLPLAGTEQGHGATVPATTIPGDSLNATLTPFTPLPIPNTPHAQTHTPTFGGTHDEEPRDPIAELNSIPGEFGRKMRAAVDLINSLPESMRAGMTEAIEFEIKRTEARRFIADLERRDADTTPGSTWKPVDLGPALRGELTQETPEIGLVRTDGHALLYAGKEHTIIGEMESGKTWIALACAAAELRKGHRVLYIHFEESDPRGTVERLRVLGVPVETIAANFAFVAPEEPGNGDWMAELLNPVPSLVVLDGVNEGMVLHGQAIREEDGAAMFRRLMVKPATRLGATVLSCDHVVKDAAARGRAAIGTVHKVNAIDGAVIMVENSKPFGRGRRGESRVYITKDRPGAHRAVGFDTDLPGKTLMGTFVVDADPNKLTFTKDPIIRFDPPPKDRLEGAESAEDVLADLPVVNEPGLPAGRYVGEIAALYKAKYTDNPRGGYTKAEIRTALLAGLKGQERKSTWNAVTRAYDKLLGDGFLVPVPEENPSEREDGKHRWRGPEDGPRPGAQTDPDPVSGGLPSPPDGGDTPVPGALGEDGEDAVRNVLKTSSRPSSPGSS